MRHLILLLLCSCSAAHYPAGPRYARQEGPAQGLPAVPPQKLVVTGRVEVIAPDVDGLVRAVRDRARAVRGQVANEEVSGATRDQPRASVRVRLPPDEVTPFVDWLGTRAEVLARDLAAQDVSQTYVDQELALRNLRTTMERLEALAARGGKLSEVLEIEREVTRVRGEIERIEGEHRLLGDRVALAVIDLSIAPAAGALAPRAMFQLMPSAAVLAFADPRGRPGTRAGAGLTLMFSRLGSLELQLFPATRADPRAVFVTVQSAAYSDFLGGGRRRFLNPYLGLLAGGAEVSGEGAFTAGALLGVELYRGPHLLVDLTTRAQLVLYSKEKRPTDTALQAGLGVGVPF
jgi:hypothetical protein